MNKVKFGLSNCVMAPVEEISSENVYTYGTPINVPGSVNLTLNPTGEDTDFYADNVRYFSDSANDGYDGELEVAMLPDEVRTSCLGETIDANGALHENANDIHKPFAFGFQINGDKTNRRYWYYNCTLSRPNGTAKTMEKSKTPQTDTMTIKSMPRLGDKEVRTYLEPNEENKSVYNSFFNSVYEKPKSI